MRVLALTKYDSLAATTRQRFFQYEPALAAQGITVEYAPLLSNDHLERLVRGQKASISSLLRAYFGRLVALMRARNFDVLWVHYELFPYFPGFLETLAKLWNQPIILDYDDAIFHRYDTSPNLLIRLLLAKKLVPLLRSSFVCCCGNAYLRDYAAQFCQHTIVLPTVVDTSIYRPIAKLPDAMPLTIGWIGSPTTWRNVQPLLPLLRKLTEDHSLRVHIVGAGVDAERDRFPGLELIEWSEAREVEEVQTMDIGIMPLLNLPFERGKSGYKLVQYMACGLPVVASPVGVNCTMVADGVNGFLASTEEEWRQALTRLILDPELRASMGDAGRASAEASYSLASQAPRLVELFRTVGQSRLR